MNEELPVQDFYLAAFLHSEGIPLNRHTRAHGYSTFFFEKENTVDDILGRFYSGNATVDLLNYSNAIKALKAIMYSSNTTSKQHNNYVKQSKGYFARA